MKYTIDFLQNPNLLEKKIFIESDLDDGRAIFIGLYRKENFESLADFAQFTQNISSLTQDWYRGAELEEAYEFYYPDESPKEKCWFYSASTHRGSLRFWASQKGIAQFDLYQIPEDLNGYFYCFSDSDSFAAVGETDTHYFDAYVADS